MDDLTARKPIGQDKETGLQRTLGAASLISLGIGAIIEAGMFSLTGIAAADYAEPAVVLSFLVALPPAAPSPVSAATSLPE